MTDQRKAKYKSARRATYQDVLDAPEHKVAEVIDGTLYTFPRPAPPHAVAMSGLMGILGPPFNHGRGGPGGWLIVIEPELHLGDEILVPDLAGWRRERMSELPKTAYFSLPPDWVCEILSPSTRKVDLDKKRPIYAREGVSHLWLVDPIDQTLEAFELRDGEWVLIATLKDDDPVSVPPFDAITFSLGDLWWPEAPADEPPMSLNEPSARYESPAHSEAPAQFRPPAAQQRIMVDLGRPATYQDVLDAPEHVVAEVIDGVLYTFPRPAPPHTVAMSRLMFTLGPPFDQGKGGPGGWLIVTEPELHLGDVILVPDLAGWRRERMPELPETAYFSLPSDWVCEIHSPSTRKVDLDKKRPIYAREGVGHLWLVDPIGRTLEAFELRDGEWVLLATLADNAPVSVPPFEAITFSLGDLWWPEAPADEPPKSLNEPSAPYEPSIPASI